MKKLQFFFNLEILSAFEEIMLLNTNHFSELPVCRNLPVIANMKSNYFLDFLSSKINNISGTQVEFKSISYYFRPAS